MTELMANRIITQKQAAMLLKELRREKDASVFADGKDFKFTTDYYSISITYYTGLRVSELSQLTWGDIYDDHLIVRKGKGSKPRTVFYGAKTRKMFQDYRLLQIKYCNSSCDGKDRIFIGQRGPLTRFGFHSRFKYWVKRLGLPDSLSWHSLRHGYGTRLLEGGVPLPTVRDLLGHSNISITSSYLHFTQEAKEIVGKLT